MPSNKLIVLFCSFLFVKTVVRGHVGAGLQVRRTLRTISTRRLEEKPKKRKNRKLLREQTNATTATTATREDPTKTTTTTTTNKEQYSLDNPPPPSPRNTATTTTTTSYKLNSNVTTNFTAISLTACEKIEMAVSFLTSLDFDKAFMNLTLTNLELAANNTYTSRTSRKTRRNTPRSYYLDVYLLQIIITPLSLAMVLFGSNLLLPTCCLAAAALGVFIVFHLVNYMSKSSSLLLRSIDLDCQMKLAFSAVSATISAMAASTFVRFGLFSVGALAAGGGSYLILDAFPFLDPTRENNVLQHDNGIDATVELHGVGNQESELSAFGWIATIVAGVCGGIMLRWYEQASLEVVTSVVGGVGCAYSLHSFVIIQGGQLHRSLVFLVASFIAMFGWRFQRGRRLRRDEYYHKKSYDEQPQSSVPQSQYSYAALPMQPQRQPPPPPPAAAALPLQPQPQSMVSLDQLQNTLSSLQGLLQGANQSTTTTNAGQQGPSSEEIVELTQSLNQLLNRMGSNSSDRQGQ